MDDEPWDESGPRAPMTKKAPPSPPRSSRPPAAAFTRASSSTTAQYAPPAAAFSRTSSNLSRSSFQDDDMASDDEDDVIPPDTHSRIRQEALRMLEVADAGDSHYSVHRTATGGFTAAPRSLGTSKPRALSGLNFVADRTSKSSKRFTDSVSGFKSKFEREEYEYGDDSVVDVVGLESRAKESARSPSSSKKNNWSSRYSIDSTMLAMSGGAIKTQREYSANGSSSTTTTAAERLSAMNLFPKSPTNNSNVFGSGFSFRQKHVFGKQNVTISTDNIQSVWRDQAPLNSSSVKTWQEQILLKRQKRRRIVFGLACFLFILVPALSLGGVHHKKIIALVTPDDDDHEEISFFVTCDGPYNQIEIEKLEMEVARVANETSFNVHLGNVGNLCDNVGHASEVANMLIEHSPHRVFMVPGQYDWNECPNPDIAWEDWWNTFRFFDKHWDNIDNDDFLVYRQRNQLENWSFVRSGVLFLGVHAVNGIMPDPVEFEQRAMYNYRWVMGMLKEHRQEVRAVVIFGNARPGFDDNLMFFAEAEEFWRDQWDTPVLYMHASAGKGATVTHYKPFNDLEHVYAAQLDARSEKGPMRVTVGLGDMPFTFHAL